MTVTALSTPLSLNELNFYLTRAIFGTGGSFSVASECSKAVCWLVMHNHPIDELLCALLSKPCPNAPKMYWQTEHTEQNKTKEQATLIGCNSALYAGSVVADQLVVGATSIAIQTIDLPILFAAIVASSLPKNMAWQCKFGTESLCKNYDGTYTTSNGFNTIGLQPNTVHIQRQLPPASPQSVQPHDNINIYQHGIALKPQTWQLLWQSFHATLVPSNPKSHLQGAGAGTSDND